MTDLQTVRLAKFFTSARRFPILIGKLPGNGGRVWGGPYTVLQISIGSLVLVAGYNTMAIWGSAIGSPLVQLLFLVIVAAGATWFSGKIPSGSRKIWNTLLGAFGALSVPGTGRYQGARVVLPRPHQFTGAVLMNVAPASAQLTPLKDSLHDVIAGSASPHSTPTIEAAATAPVPALPPVDVVVDAADDVPDNVITLPPSRTYTSGLDRLLEQARRMESN